MRGAVAEAYVEAQENAKFSGLRAPATETSVATWNLAWPFMSWCGRGI